MNFSIYETLEIIVIYQCFSFAGNLVSNKGLNTNFNLWLAILLLVVGLNFLNVLLLSTEFIPSNLNFGLVFGFLYGPLFLIYTEQIIAKSTTKSQTIRPLNFIPAGIAFPLLVIGNFYEFIVELLLPVTLLVVFHVLIYIAICLRKIRDLQSNLKRNFSTTENKNLDWLKSLLITFSVIIVLTPVETILPLDLLPSSINLPFIGIVLFTLLSVNLIYFRGLSYPEVFNEFVLRTSGKKYADSKLSSNELDLKLDIIQHYMITEKPYLDFELSLKNLSERINMSPRDLSQTINDKLGKNFFEFVNDYRLEEAKKLLSRHTKQEMRINEIMYAAGFNSKSTFNSIFKNHLGKTPREYRNQN